MRKRLSIWALLGLMLVLTSQTLAAITPDQRDKLKKADDTVTRALALFKNKKFKDSADAANTAGTALTDLLNAKDKDVTKAAEQILDRLKSVHGDLELQGAKVQPLPTAPADTAMPAKTAATTKPTTPAKPATTTGKTPAGGVSFVKDVLPSLAGKCAKCHITDSKGGFNFDTFNAFMKGSKDGPVVLPGKGSGSRIVEVLESGDMPRGGGKYSKEDIATLTKWIDEGAKFDGKNPAMSLAGLAPGKMMADGPKLELVRATGSETIQFSRDIAPILATNCVSCHGDQMPRARLDLNRFSGILKSGDSGRVLSPGKPAESLLVKKIKGTAGERMPLKKSPLSSDDIAKIEKWVAEGAKFDGEETATSMRVLMDLYKARHSTHEELAAARAELADKDWRTALSDEKPLKVESKNFLVIGNAGEDTLKEVADLAEQQAVVLARMFKGPSDAPFIKGKMTLFVFRQRIDYSEFIKMLEERTLPSDTRASWNFTVMDAYGCILPPTTKTDSLNAEVTQVLASTYIAAFDHVPYWFSEGVGLSVASKLDPKSKNWDEKLPQVLAALEKPDSFITARSHNEEADLATYGFVKAMMGSGNAGHFSTLLAGLRKEEQFDKAFQKAYNTTPQAAAASWGQLASRGKKK